METLRSEYKRSSVVSQGMDVLVKLERVLPKPAYDRLFHAVLSGYRSLLRASYLWFWVWHLITGNREARRRNEVVFRVMPYSLVGWRGLEATSQVLAQVARGKVEGALVECGVAQGGSAALMALAAAEMSHRPALWLFDSFEGLPDPTPEDFRPGDGKTGAHLRPLRRGSCLGTQKEVQELLFDTLHLDRNGIFIVKGWFQETLPRARERVGRIAVLRLDCDWYESTKCCLEHLYDKVVPYGYLIIDDYGSCYGAKKALEEFLRRRGLTANVNMVFDGRGGCYFKKPSASVAGGSVQLGE